MTYSCNSFLTRYGSDDFHPSHIQRSLPTRRVHRVGKRSTHQRTRGTLLAAAIALESVRRVEKENS